MVFQNSLNWLRGPATYGVVLYPRTDSARGVVSFTDGLKFLASRMKRLGYPLDCSVDITRCFSLIWSDFVVGIFAARSIKDLTTAHLCILG